VGEEELIDAEKQDPKLTWCFMNILELPPPPTIQKYWK